MITVVLTAREAAGGREEGCPDVRTEIRISLVYPVK